MLSSSCPSLCHLVRLFLAPLCRILHLCEAHHRIVDRKIECHYWNNLRRKSPVKWIIIRQLEACESGNQEFYSYCRSEGIRYHHVPWLALICPNLVGDLQNVFITQQATDRIIWNSLDYFNVTLLVFSGCFVQSTLRILRDWSHLKRYGPTLADTFACLHLPRSLTKDSSELFLYHEISALFPPIWKSFSLLISFLNLNFILFMIERDNVEQVIFFSVQMKEKLRR